MPRYPRFRKLPLVTLAVEQAIFASESEARRWIMAGQVLVNDRPLDKPGMLVPADAVIRVRGDHRYASRGGYKLQAALDHFGISVAGRVSLDCGASTGGFTDCLLQYGALRVYAVEAGYGQLVGRLRADPRVCNLERTNLSDLMPEAFDLKPTLVTLDLSYLSLVQALPIAAHLLAPEGELLALLKPLFEVESAEARRSGRILDTALIIAALERVLTAGQTVGLVPQGAAKLALRPRHGIHEYIVHFLMGGQPVPWRYNAATLAALVSGSGIGYSGDSHAERIASSADSTG